MLCGTAISFGEEETEAPQGAKLSRKSFCGFLHDDEGKMNTENYSINCVQENNRKNMFKPKISKEELNEM